MSFFFIFVVELIMNTQATQLVSSACQALGNIFRSGTLPLPTGGEGGEEEGGGGEMEVEEEGEEEVVTKLKLVESLVQLSKNAKHDKVSSGSHVLAWMYCICRNGLLFISGPKTMLK